MDREKFLEEQRMSRKDFLEERRVSYERFLEEQRGWLAERNRRHKRFLWSLVVIQIVGMFAGWGLGVLLVRWLHS